MNRIEEVRPDPLVAALLRAMRLTGKQFYDLKKSLAANRRQVEIDSRLAGGLPARIYGTLDINIRPNLPVRVYRPSGAINLPLVLFFHGGGWVTGSIGTHDNICRKLSNRASAIVVSVGYRLAPENKFPAAVEDACAALNWAAAGARSLGADPARIVVAGDSAGGNLAAVACLIARDQGGPPVALQVLAYPGADASNLDTESYRKYGSGYYLTRQGIEQIIPMYVNFPDEVHHPHVSPLLAADLGRLPPALVLTAGFDPLRDEGEAYALRLTESGVPCRLHRFSSMIHGFLSLGGLLPQADQAIAEMAAMLSATSL